MELNNLYDWLPKDAGIIIEDSEDSVYIKHNGEIKATYSHRATEALLKEGVEKILATTKQGSLANKIA
jgi:hypothetical protein